MKKEEIEVNKIKSANVNRDVIIEIKEKANKLDELYVRPHYIIISAELYVLFCEQCARLSGKVAFITEFQGLKIVIIPKVKEYLEVTTEGFGEFIHAFAESVKVEKTTIDEMKKDLNNES